MSLLFKALKRNQPERAGTDGQPEPSPPNANVYSLGRLFSSFPVLVVAAVLLFTVGVLAAQGVQFLTGRMPPATTQSVPEPAIAEAVTTPAVAQTRPEAETESLWKDNSPPDQWPDAPGPEANGTDGGGAPTAIVTQFYPPETITGSLAGAGDPGVMPHRTHAGDMGNRQPAKPSPAASTLPERLASPQPGYFTMASVPAEPVQGPPALEAMPVIRKQETSNGTAANPAGDAEPDGFEKGRTRSHLQVSRLAERILGAIQAGDDGLTADLLSQLVAIKGPDHLFVLKLNAYWCVQQGRMQKARELLTQVLVRRPDDREAGLNMAVVDIQDGRQAAARRRLEHLHELYPEDRATTDYLSQLVLHR